MSSDPISDAAEGFAKGALDWSANKIELWIDKFKHGKLAFIQERKTIDIVKEQYNSGEGKFYEIYIEDKELLFIVRLGLTLRKLENDEDRLKNLRDKIFRKYKIEGLHIAEFAQNGVLNHYVGILIEELISIDDLKKDIKEVLKNIEKHALFVQQTTKKAEIIKKVSIVVSAHAPSIYIISAFKSAAKTLQDCTKSLQDILKDYKFEKFSGGEKEILFFRRNLIATPN